jgi:hypothetical protein
MIQFYMSLIHGLGCDLNYHGVDQFKVRQTNCDNVMNSGSI